VPSPPEAGPDREEEQRLLDRARRGDRDALEALLEPHRRPLFAYVYRMVTHRQDAEDLLQEAMARAIERLTDFRGEARFRTWLFGIATHACLDHLRRKRRWRVETQLDGEARARADPERMAAVGAMMAQSDFRFEIREHIAFCFACVGRALPPEGQAAMLLREVLGFTGAEAAAIVGISEPRLRHRLADARRTMVEGFEGMCQLVNKSGACWQCRSLRELAPPENRGEDLVRIEVRPGVAVTPESLFEARLDIVRSADLEEGRTAGLHADFFAAVTRRVEEPSGDDEGR
jgi:RNA polymerase sigma-70 factor (ECF subfamily)